MAHYDLIIEKCHPTEFSREWHKFVSIKQR